MDHLGTAKPERPDPRYIARSAGCPKRPLSLDRPGDIPDLVLPLLPRFLPGEICLTIRSQSKESWGGSLQQASNSAASRPPAIDLKLRLTLRVAALAAICFIAVAAYALFDSDRVAKAKAGRIAEIVARDLSLQQSQAQWLSVSISSTPDLQAIAALMEPGLCIAYRDNTGAFRQGVCSGAPADEMTAPEIFASLYRAVFRPGEPVSIPVVVAGSNRGMAVANFDPATQIGQSWREASRLLSIMAFALAGLCVAVYAV